VAWQKWWDILWEHPIYQISVVLNPYFRTTWVLKTMKQLSIPADKQKEMLTRIKQVWLDWMADHTDES
jgi:hypothetical protein